MKRTRNSAWVLVLNVAIVLMLLVGCTNNSGAGAGKVNNVELTMKIWGTGYMPPLQEIITAFKEKHSNINVKLETTPFDQYWTVLEAGATGGAMPDVLWMNSPNFPLYASSNMFLPYNDRLKKDKITLTDHFPKQLIDMYTYKGNIYGVPQQFDTVGLWYNKEMFDAAKLSYPDETWKWNDLIEAAKKLTIPAKNQWGFAIQNDQQGFYNTVYQAGGYAINNENGTAGFTKGKEGLGFWADMIHKHKVSPTLPQLTDTRAQSMFESERLAMLYMGSWLSLSVGKNELLKNKIGIAPLPSSPDGKRASIIHSQGFVTAKNTKHPDEAWEFVKFLASKQAHEILVKHDVASAYKGLTDSYVKKMPELNRQVFVDAIANSVPYPASINTAKWVEVQNKYFNMLMLGTISLDEAVKKIDTEIEALLAKEKK
jgi:multiple sugar transport system substrate-binding protein